MLGQTFELDQSAPVCLGCLPERDEFLVFRKNVIYTLLNHFGMLITQQGAWQQGYQQYERRSRNHVCERLFLYVG